MGYCQCRRKIHILMLSIIFLRNDLEIVNLPHPNFFVAFSNVVVCFKGPMPYLKSRAPLCRYNIFLYILQVPASKMCVIEAFCAVKNDLACVAAAAMHHFTYKGIFFPFEEFVKTKLEPKAIQKPDSIVNKKLQKLYEWKNDHFKIKTRKCSCDWHPLLHNQFGLIELWYCLDVLGYFNTF